MNPQEILQKMILLGKVSPEQAQQMQRRWMLEQAEGQRMVSGPEMGPPVSMRNPNVFARMAPLPTDAMMRGQMATTPIASNNPVRPQASPMPSPFAMMPQAQGLQPDQRAIIDALTGKRVHKDLSGRQMGLQGVNPSLKYLLYSMRGRRHLSTSGKDVY